MDDEHEKYMKRCYELAISAGKKGYDILNPTVRNPSHAENIMKDLLMNY
ncbi:MAG: hypothetical protein IKG87_01110 [Clostridia bacterium]|nr:hypothetical protein [Clostridia bacterium]